MGIGASFTLLFVAGFFSTMFWLISRMPAPAGPRPGSREASTPDSSAG
jgi:hypothetical protein